ncbi:MAG: hypothetical protein EP305_10350 [Bacteroidetes bacterium]|nr:MAG: hypothetical protein EP305_10350 [Bacteroidota bacterium]
MKTKILTLAALGIILTSCGGPGKAEYDTAAQKICDCMSKKTAENEAAAAESDFNIDMTDLDYSLCALEVAGDVDPFDDQMGKSIAEKCPDLNETHKKYVEGSK